MVFPLSKNAYCPCGSGKKYKVCCMGELSTFHEAYYGLLHKEELIKGKLVKWAAENFGEEGLDDYSRKFNKKSFNELESSEDFANFFDWFFLEATHYQNGKRILNIILDDFSPLFDTAELNILKGWVSGTQAGIFEVEATNPDDWKISLKDIFTAKKYEIIDRKASECAIRGDIIFGRVQKIFSNYYLSGSVTSYPRFTLLNQLKDFVNTYYNLKKLDKPSLTYEEFMNSNSRILNDFVPKDMKFVTSAGEEAKLCEAIYSINSDYINNTLDWFANNAVSFLIVDTDYKHGKFKSAHIACLKQKNKKNKIDKSGGIQFTSNLIGEDGHPIETEGSIDIENNKLKFFSTSETLFNELNKKLTQHLGGNIKLEKSNIQSTDELLEELEENKEKQPKNRKENSKLIKIEKQVMEQYYRDWCDQKIPALNDKKPREVIKTKEGKELLKKLLLDFENQEEHQKREGNEDCVSAVKIIREELNFYE